MDDFYARRVRIRKGFATLNDRDKRVYRMYIYSNRLLTSTVADLVWEYLTEPINSHDFPSAFRMQAHLKKCKKVR